MPLNSDLVDKVSNCDRISIEVLIHRIKEGDQRAFESLINRYDNQILKIIRSEIRNSNDVPDVYQEVRIAIWKGIGSVTRSGLLDWGDSVKAWVKKVARNKCADHGRSKQSREVPHSEAEVAQFLFGRSRDQFKQEELCAKLDDAIAELPPIYREVVELYRDGWKIDEIAATKKPYAIHNRNSSLISLIWLIGCLNCEECSAQPAVFTSTAIPLPVTTSKL